MEPMKPMAPMRPMAPMDSGPPWWPGNLGQPSTSGGQNDLRYAYFPDASRLAVEEGGKVTVYNTGDHHISGVSQQQGGGQTLSFSSQNGSVRLDELRKVS